MGLGDVIQPGRQAQLKFTDQGNIFLMYTFGGNGDEMNLPLSDGSGAHRKVVGSKMEIGVAVSRDGQHWSRYTMHTYIHTYIHKYILYRYIFMKPCYIQDSYIRNAYKQEKIT